MTDTDLGVLGDLATALGVMQDGSADPGWFGDPGARLKTVLSDDDQRAALVSFLDTVLDDGTVDTDAQGRTFLPLVDHDDPDLTIGVVLEPTPTSVRIGLGVELTTTATTGPDARPATHTRLDVALFESARGSSPAPDPRAAARPARRPDPAAEHRRARPGDRPAPASSTSAASACTSTSPPPTPTTTRPSA